ncbi:heme peroxidase [Capsulimonas corticalis]|uniref:Heme peroxidase n=1 Tax=Capsulimonas corticalis TaxID=2219043 RepID=A0A402CUD2_9BACT|nr:peroxidase family protein [Capsulimonas corticalis]BDI28932.1 heme peroxidase [Capsulimonas corticalis]
MNQSVHGGVGTREQQFTHLLPLRKKTYDIGLLCDIAEKMKSSVDGVHDGPDPEENIWMPAGYTYFGQFIDHDLTFDNTSSLNPTDSTDQSRQPTNLRTPRFDLDSVHGDGPDAQPFMYDSDGASLLFKDGTKNVVPFSNPVSDQADQDLLRSPNGRAIIGDKRNDENVIVGQLQLLFIRYHNAVVQKLKAADPALSGTALFEKARNEVRWTYQKLVVEDFLPRIARAEVFADLAGAASSDERKGRYALYTVEDHDNKRKNLPREFVVAAYRFGHSAVRQGYRLNDTTSKDIFPGSNAPADEATLLGFKPLPQAFAIDINQDFERFFPSTDPITTFENEAAKKRAAGGDEPDPTVRLQFAYKIDTNIVDPLGVLPLNVLPTSSAKGGAMEELGETIAPRKLPEPPSPPRPSLALLNLLRGNVYHVQSGQAIAAALRAHGFDKALALTEDQLVVRTETDDHGSDAKIYRFEHIDSAFASDTPLWFYILAESQAPIADHFGVDNEFSEDELLNGVGASTQLGWVGGRIIAEVFYGLLDSDEESFINAAPTGWKPILGGTGEPIFLNLVKFVVDNPVPDPVPPAGADKTDTVVAAAEGEATPDPMTS